jgi:hypothetical protein
MIAYLVHNPETAADRFVLPEMGCAVAVTPERFETFISPGPVFAEWSGDTCGDADPEAFGTVVASRDEAGDVCILHEGLWRERMAAYSDLS